MDMDRICQYSTIIFAGNVTVLLMVAVSTDYWQYRSFNQTAIITTFEEGDTNVSLYLPSDTDSFLLVQYTWDHKTKLPSPSPRTASEVHYQSPAYVLRYYFTEVKTLSEIVFDGINNVTKFVETKLQKKIVDYIFLFKEYGNLYRNCDAIEERVRVRIELSAVRESRCNIFLSEHVGEDYIWDEVPAVPHLERLAMLMSLVCLASSVASLICGAKGSLLQEGRGMMWASYATLISGVSMTVGIALFHGKCYLLQRRPFMDKVDLPHKDIFNEAKRQHYGWSFVLAWICIALCFVHTYVWLSQAQGMPYRAIRRRKLHGSYQIITHEDIVQPYTDDDLEYL